MTTLDAQALRDRLNYNPDTGQFTYRSRHYRCEAGDIAGWMTPKGYLVVHFKGKRCQMHRLAFLYMTGAFPEGVIDHINGERADNRWSNLRVASHSMNGQNQKRAQRSNKSSGLLGVTKKGGRWMAQIKAGPGTRYIGLYITKEAAHEAYLDAKRKFHEGNTL